MNFEVERKFRIADERIPYAGVSTWYCFRPSNNSD